MGGAGSLPAIYLGPNYGGGNKDNGTSFKISNTCTATLSALNPAPGHHQPVPPLETPGHSQATLGQSLVGSLLLSPGSQCIRFSLCPPRVYFQVLCKFCKLFGGVNGDLLQEDLCQTQVCCTQSPVPVAVHLCVFTSVCSLCLIQ